MKLVVKSQGSRIDWFAASDINAWDATQLRWVYRMMRRNGISRSTARMYISCAYNIGVRTQMVRP